MEKLSNEGLTSEYKLQQEKIKFKNFLEKEFVTSKNYKSDLNGLKVHGQDLNQVLKRQTGC